MSSDNTFTFSSSTSKTKRGRPRLQKSDLTQTERRRAQVREAQRTYRMKKETTIRSLQARVNSLENSLSSLQILLKKLDCNGSVTSNQPVEFYVSLISQIHREMKTTIIKALSNTEKVEPEFEINATPSVETKKIQSSVRLPTGTATISRTRFEIKPKDFKQNDNKRIREENCKESSSERVSKVLKLEDQLEIKSESVNSPDISKIKIEPQDYDVPFLLSPSSGSNSSSPLYMPEFEENNNIVKASDPLLTLIKTEPLDENSLNNSNNFYQKKKQEKKNLPLQYYEYTNIKNNDNNEDYFGNKISNNDNNNTQIPLTLSDTVLGSQISCGMNDSQQLQQQQQEQRQYEQQMLSQQQPIGIMEPSSQGFSDIYQRILAVDSFDLFVL